MLIKTTQPVTSGVSLRRIDGREGLPPNAVSDRQSAHPTQARLDATVYLAATTISDLFPTTDSETGRDSRRDRQGGTATGTSIYDAPNGPKDATEM
jgi:hypothetical protein